MTRSEERLKVGTEQVETGRVRLVKHVVTEQQQITVPVSHEEVRLEREPIADGRPGRELADDEQEIRLHADRPVVDKEAVQVERLRLGKDTVTEQETFSTRCARSGSTSTTRPGGSASARARALAPGRGHSAAPGATLRRGGG